MEFSIILSENTVEDSVIKFLNDNDLCLGDILKDGQSFDSFCNDIKSNLNESIKIPLVDTITVDDYINATK